MSTNLSRRVRGGYVFPEVCRQRSNNTNYNTDNPPSRIASIPLFGRMAASNPPLEDNNRVSGRRCLE